MSEAKPKAEDPESARKKESLAFKLGWQAHRAIIDGGKCAGTFLSQECSGMYRGWKARAAERKQD